jgi:hypothetical protein
MRPRGVPMPAQHPARASAESGAPVAAAGPARGAQFLKHHVAINPRRRPLHAPSSTLSPGRAATGFQAGMGA